MKRFLRVVLLCVLVSVIPCSRGAVDAQAQQPAPTPSTPTLLTNAPLTHLGIVAPDLEKVARGYADIFGIPVPEITTIKIELPNAKKADVRVAYVPMPNFYLKLMQPVTKSGPVYEFLQKFGLGIYSLGVGIDGNIDAVRAELVSKGGKWTGGVKGGAYALVDFRQTPIGSTLEVGPTKPPAMPTPPATQSGLFGRRPISHVGWANTDAAASVTKFVEVFGMPRVEPRRFPPTGWFPYPPNMWSTMSTVQTCMLRQGTIGIEIIQSVGEPTPWTFHIKKHGVSAMHIAVGRGTLSREDWLRIGQEKGGKWTNGGPPPEGTFAYLDWDDTLGIVIE
jgi:catechol 2,3-dioxygenase-like lactoylglutathione lyase family enzyme